jgi:hypothetical protein
MRRASIFFLIVGFVFILPAAAKIAGPPGIEQVISTQVTTPIGTVVDVLGNEMYISYPAFFAEQDQIAVVSASQFYPSPPTVYDKALRATVITSTENQYLIAYNPRDRLHALARDQTRGLL